MTHQRTQAPTKPHGWAPKAIVDEETLVRALLGALLLTAGLTHPRTESTRGMKRGRAADVTAGPSAPPVVTERLPAKTLL